MRDIVLSVKRQKTEIKVLPLHPLRQVRLIRGNLEDVLKHFTENEPRGEFVIVLAGAEEPKKEKKSRKYRTEEDDAEED